MIVNTLTAKAVSEGKITIFGGKQFRPLLHVKDAAQAIVDVLETTDNGVFNLSMKNINMLDLAKLVKFQIPCKLEVVKTTTEDSRNYRVTAHKAKATFGFNPIRTISNGVEEIESVIRERIKDPNSSRYSNQGFLNVN